MTVDGQVPEAQAKGATLTIAASRSRDDVRDCGRSGERDDLARASWPRQTRAATAAPSLAHQAYVSGTGAGSEEGARSSSRTSPFLKRYMEKERGSAPAT